MKSDLDHEELNVLARKTWLSGKSTHCPRVAASLQFSIRAAPRSDGRYGEHILRTRLSKATTSAGAPLIRPLERICNGRPRAYRATLGGVHKSYRPASVVIQRPTLVAILVYDEEIARTDPSKRKVTTDACLRENQLVWGTGSDCYCGERSGDMLMSRRSSM